jgi:RNA polymerase sigma-70 factor (ECF subfamily)
MTDSRGTGHDGMRDVMSSEVELPAGAFAGAPECVVGRGVAEPVSFDTVYQEHFAFVWRSMRRLGVPEPLIDDAVQEVFVVVHRQLGSIEIRIALRAWLFGIVARVASEFRRKLRRKDPHTRAGGVGPDVESVADTHGKDPQVLLERVDALRVLHELLQELDWTKRQVFVLVELEELSVPEVADALGVNLNTAYSRIRAARVQFNEAVARRLAQEERRTR